MEIQKYVQFNENVFYDWKKKKFQVQVTTFNKKAKNQVEEYIDQGEALQHFSLTASPKILLSSSSQSSRSLTPKKMRRIMFERFNVCVIELEIFEKVIKEND